MKIRKHNMLDLLENVKSHSTEYEFHGLNLTELPVKFENNSLPDDETIVIIQGTDKPLKIVYENNCNLELCDKCMTVSNTEIYVISDSDGIIDTFDKLHCSNCGNIHYFNGKGEITLDNEKGILVYKNEGRIIEFNIKEDLCLK